MRMNWSEKYLKKMRSEVEERNEDANIAVSVKDLYKSFKLPTEKSWGLKQAIFNRLRGIKGYSF